MDKLEIRVFRAINDVNSSLEFLKKQRDALLRYGLINVCSLDDSWMKNPYVYCIVAESKVTTQQVGGVRIHCVSNSFPLPLEIALNTIDPKIEKKLDENDCELAGLWVAKQRNSLSGLAHVLMRTGVAVARMYGIQRVLGAHSNHTNEISDRLGFRIDTKLHGGGVYAYPTSEYQTTFVYLDPTDLRSAHPTERKRIVELCTQAELDTVEFIGRCNMPVYYRLRTETLPVKAQHHSSRLRPMKDYNICGDYDTA